MRIVFYTFLMLAAVPAPQAAALINSPIGDIIRDVAAESGTETPEQGNRLTIINDGYEALVLRVHLIRSARKTIDIQTFILADDESAQYLMYELLQAARRGVRVRLLTDHFMSSRDEEWVAFLSTAHPNFELRYYRPPAGRLNPSKPRELFHSLLFFQGANQRMHNKTFIVDGDVAIIGGRNIDNHYYNHSLTYNFIDRDAMIIGPAVPLVAGSFEEYWDFRRSIPGDELKDVRKIIKRGKYQRREGRDDFDLNGYFDDADGDADDPEYIRERFVETMHAPDRVEFLVDNPGKNRAVGLWGGGKHTRQLQDVLSETEESLIVQSPYLILNMLGRRTFRKIRRRHPDAEFIFSTNSFASTDNTLAYSANYKLRPYYLGRLDFRIYEYRAKPDDLLERLPNYPELERRAQEEIEAGRASRKPFLSIHAKSFVQDDKVAYIGSYNIDPRSDNLNTEIGLLIEDEEVAKGLKKEILATTRPGCSWVIARRQYPLDGLTGLVEGISGLTPVDIWPLRNSSSYALREGQEPVPPGHPEFYARYADAGSFPGNEGFLSTKEIVTRLYKMLNGLTLPVL